MYFKKPISLVILPLVAVLSACSGGNNIVDKIPSTDKLLIVDLHTFMPNGSSSADLVSITKTQDIADDFFAKTGIKIKWYTGKTLDGETEEASADYIKSIQNGTMPAIGFSWSAFKDRGYYMDLGKYLDTPNEFLSEEEQKQYPTWKSQFPSYIWQTKECSMADGSIISIPVYLNPGPATGWFYNKTALEGQYEVPVTWSEFKVLANEVGSNSAGPFVYNQTAKISNWEFLFSIGPAFADLLKDVVDTNKDGVISELETIEGVLNGYYSPIESENPNYYEYAQGAYQILKDFYTNILPENWESVDSETYWSNGQAMLRQNGLWSIKAEDNKIRDWQYGVFPAPLVSKDSSTFLKSKGLTKAASDVKEIKTIKVPEKKYTSAELTKAFVDLYKPTASCYLNLMKHGIYSNEKVLENAVKFLKFMSTPANVSKVCVEHQGIIGGVYDSDLPDSLEKWLQSTFPSVPTTYWPDGYTVGNNANINKSLQGWIAGTVKDSQFYQTISSEQKIGAQAYKESLSQASEK